MKQIKIQQMQNSDPLTQLKQLQERLKLKTKSKQTNEIEGQIIEILRRIRYFKTQSENYGIEVLSYYIPIIQPYILRAGMPIIEGCQEYVVVEGVVRGMKVGGVIGNVYTDGMIIDPALQTNKSDYEKQTLSSSSDCDTKLIKIIRNSSDPKLSKSAQNLSKFQKQRLGKQRDMQRLIISDKNFQSMKQKLKNFQFFHSLGTYDLNELITNSKILFLKKSAVLHQFGQQVNRVGFLLSGEIKIDNSVIHNKDKPVEAGRLLLEKYMVHKKQHVSSVVSMVEPGQWIGLEEYLWGQNNFLSHAQVVSHDGQILYIPTQTFQKKFNQLTSYYLMNKLKGLIETKKKILDKQIKTKRQKQDEMTFQKMRREAIEKIQQKVDRRQYMDRKQKQKQRDYVSPQNSSTLIKSRRKNIQNRNFPNQCYMPERLVHKIKVYEQKYESLPKIEERFVLFPEQYEKAMIPLELRDQLKAAKSARDKTVKKKEVNRPFKLLSNDKIYETVIYASLSPKNSNPEKDERIAKLKSKASIEYSIDTDYKSDMLDTIGSVSTTGRFRFNESIFNNFRAPKNKGQRLLEHITKTLQII